jgi:Fe-S-cluster containining protein
MAAEGQEVRIVPCGSCTACCRTQWVFLDPDSGDVPALYDTVDVIDPKSGAPVKALAHKPSGECVYLGSTGCTIHDRAPAMCRAFDCRAYYLAMMSKPRTVRKREIRDQYSAKELFEIGRDLQRKHPVDPLVARAKN